MNIKITTRTLLAAEAARANARANARGYANPASPRHDLGDLKLYTAVGEIVAPIIDAVREALVAVNGKATKHVLIGYDGVRALADRAEQLLEDRGVAKGNRVGTVLTYVGGAPDYKGTQRHRRVCVSTVTLKRIADGWRMTACGRDEVQAGTREVFDLTVTPEAAEDIRAAAFANIFIHQED